MNRFAMSFARLVLFVGACSIAGTSVWAGPPWVVAHRGLLLDAPENTLANFRGCLELRIGFEFDVRRSLDGHLVCVHDDTLDRTTNGNGPVAQQPLAELQRLDAGAWFSPRFRGERVPTVEEILKLIAQHPQADVLIAVDIKADDDRVEADVVRLAQRHGVLDRLLMIGRTIEQAAVRRRFQQADPRTHVACLANHAQEFPAALADPIADWVYLRYLPSAEDVSRTAARKKRVFIAGPTVAGHVPDNWQRALTAGVHGILTDHAPELARQSRLRR